MSDTPPCEKHKLVYDGWLKCDFCGGIPPMALVQFQDWTKYPPAGYYRDGGRSDDWWQGK